MQFLKSNAIDERTLRGETLFSLTVPENNMSLLLVSSYISQGLKPQIHSQVPRVPLFILIL